MYAQLTQVAARSRREFVASAIVLLFAMVGIGTTSAQEFASASAEFATPNIIRHIGRQSERLEMTTNASRILTLDMSIPRVQVNNPELIAVTPLSATQIQVSAKKPGVTQINMWDTDEKVHTIDVIIYGDVRELEFALRTQFPNSSVGVKKFSQSLMLTGFVDSPDHVGPIMRLAEDYAPKVINNLEVGGVQQVLLKVKLFEVSRTKLRKLGVDWAVFGAGGDFAVSSVSGLIEGFGSSSGNVDVLGDTLSFGVVGDTTFFGILDALQQHNIAKILAEPNIVAVSGRPAQFLEGGEVPILVPQSLGTSSIEYKPFGTQVDFLPIVLGNGNIRLEVRPRVSDLDSSIGIDLNNERIPGFRVRQADTAVEMRAGQTFALAGLIQQQTESVNRGLPFLSDIPVVGVPFRRVEEEVNEIELLILVTPEFVDAMDPHEVPPCGPGQGTMSPDNHTLYLGGHLEVPNAYGPCGPNCGGPNGCDACHTGMPVTPHAYATDQPHGAPMQPTPAADSDGHRFDEGYEAVPSGEPIHGQLRMPATGGDPSGSTSSTGNRRSTNSRTGSANGYVARRPASYRRATTPTAPPTVTEDEGDGYSDGAGLIGPVGYEVD